jgi:predicted glycosyltransferase
MKSFEASAQNHESGMEPRGDVAKRGKRRIALYSHDTMGIGHMRRNLLIAQALVDGPFKTVILLIAGARELSTLGLPPEFDCLTLLSLSKEGNGQYQPRRLDIGLEELIALRSRTLSASLAAFRPDVLTVDKVPRGAVNEVCREWRNAANHEAIRASYGAMWIYGDDRRFPCAPSANEAAFEESWLRG